MPPRSRPRPEPSNHPLNTSTAADLLARARKPSPVAVKPGSRQHPDGPGVTSAKQRFAIRMCIYGHPDKLAAPMSIGAACKAAGLQQRAARRLMHSAVFVAELEAAQAERLAQEAARAPSLPLAVNPPVNPPPPAGEAPSPAPAVSERDAAPETFPMVRLPPTDERHGSLVSAPAGYVPPVDGKILKSGVVEFDLRKHRERYPFAGDVAGQHPTTVIPRSPRRSLRKV